MPISVRPMETESEIRGKAYVHWKSWQETYPGLLDADYLDRITPEACERIAFAFSKNTLIALDGDRVVGFACHNECRDPDLPDAGELSAIYLLSEYQGTGTGRRLLEAALSLLDKPRIALWVLRGNARAIRFYEYCGFRFDGCEKPLRSDSSATELRMVLDRTRVPAPRVATGLPVRTALDRANAAYEILSQDKPIRSAQDAQGLYPLELAAPTFVLKTAFGLIGCISSFTRGRLDLPGLKERFGFSILKMADPASIRERTGFDVGSVPPGRSRSALPFRPEPFGKGSSLRRHRRPAADA